MDNVGRLSYKQITAIRLPPMAETDSRKIIILKKEEQPDQRRLPDRLEDAEPPIWIVPAARVVPDVTTRLPTLPW